VFRGWINGLKLIGSNVGAGILMLIVALFLSITATVNMIFLVKVNKLKYLIDLLYNLKD